MTSNMMKKQLNNPELDVAYIGHGMWTDGEVASQPTDEWTDAPARQQTDFFGNTVTVYDDWE